MPLVFALVLFEMFQVVNLLLNVQICIEVCWEINFKCQGPCSLVNVYITVQQSTGFELTVECNQNTTTFTNLCILL